MKKICLILFFAFTITTITGTASATVKKCVPLVDGNQTACTSNPNLYTNHIDWAAECRTNGVTSDIKGVGLCSNQDGGTFATTSETVTTSGNANENRFCWCKMTIPAVSLWVISRDYEYAGQCTKLCANDCASDVQDPSTMGAAFRSALFSGMGE